MKTVKPQTLTQTPFVEQNNLKDIDFNPAYACKRVLFNFAGTITIGTSTGSFFPTIAQASDGSAPFPYLLQMLGKITFNGTCKNGKGLKLNNVPLWVLWLLAYIENKGVGPVVNDGGMLAANFAAGTYNISCDVPLNFYDQRTPKSQHSFTYFRPNRYQKGAKFSIVGGQLYSGNYQAGIDGVAVTSDSTSNTNAPVFTYTTNIQVSATAYLVPDLKIVATEQCADRAFQYNPLFDLSASDFNQISLEDLEVQQYIIMLLTDLAPSAAGSANMVEAGVDNYGVQNNGIVETAIGTETLAKFYAKNQKAHNYDEFMTSNSVWFQGLLAIDEYDHNWHEFQKKTFLNTNIAQHNINAYGTPGADGSNFRILHTTAQLSDSAKASIRKESVSNGLYPRFAGA